MNSKDHTSIRSRFISGISSLSIHDDAADIGVVR